MGMETALSAGKYAAYPKYKDSGIEWAGDIPQHWQRLKFKFLANAGKVFASGPFGSSIGSQFYQDSGVPVIRGNNLSLDGNKPKYIDDGYVFLTESKADELSNAEVLPGDLVFTARGTVGQVGLIPTDDTVKWNRAILSANQLRFRNKSKDTNSSYLWYLFSSWLVRTQILLSSDSVAQPNLNLGSLKDLHLLFPSKSEQSQIANFLDHETAKIDTLIEEQQSLIRLLQEKRQAVTSHAVTKGLNPDAPMKDSGVVWLGEVPKHWSTTPLRHLTDEVTVGIVVTPAKYYQDSGIPCFRSLNVKENRILESDFVYISEESNELLEKSQLKTNDIVVVRSGQPGTAAVVEEVYSGANCIDLIIIRQSPKFDSQFLCYQINSEFIKYQVAMGSGGAIQQHFNVEIAKSLIICDPPLEEQTEIRQFIRHQSTKYQELIDDAELQVALLQERRTALISAAVTGKIDVREWSAPDSVSQQAAENVPDHSGIPAIHGGQQQTPEAAV